MFILGMNDYLALSQFIFTCVREFVNIILLLLQNPESRFDNRKISLEYSFANGLTLNYNFSLFVYVEVIFTMNPSKL